MSGRSNKKGGRRGKQKQREQIETEGTAKVEAVPEKPCEDIKVQSGLENIKLVADDVPTESSSINLNPDAAEYKPPAENSGDSLEAKPSENQNWGNNEGSGGDANGGNYNSKVYYPQSGRNQQSGGPAYKSTGRVGNNYSNNSNYGNYNEGKRNYYDSGKSQQSGGPAYKSTGRVGNYSNSRNYNNEGNHNYRNREGNKNFRDDNSRYFKDNSRPAKSHYDNPRNNYSYNRPRNDENRSEHYVEHENKDGNRDVFDDRNNCEYNSVAENSKESSVYDNSRVDGNVSFQTSNFSEDNEKEFDWFSEQGDDKNYHSGNKGESVDKKKVDGTLMKHWENNPNNFKSEPTKRPDDVDDDQTQFSSNKNNRTKNHKFNDKNVTMQIFDKNRKKEDNFDEYDRKFRKAKIVHKKVIEVDGNLFEADEEYSLAHCVAEDMNMGSGIALMFRQKFKQVDELINQKAKQGGLALLKDKDRYIYYLVTKMESNKKPTLLTMFKSLNKLRDHMVENNVKKLAIPRIGCGLDRLEWSEVKNMLEFIFTEIDVEIKVFNYQQAADQMQEKRTDHQFRKCPIRELRTTIKDYNTDYAIILFFGTEGKDFTPQINAIDERFLIKRDYQMSTKKKGEYDCWYKHNGHYCIVNIVARQNNLESFDFVSFKNAIVALHKENEKAAKSGEKYFEVAIQKYDDPEDMGFMSKITNLLRNTFHKVTINILD